MKQISRPACIGTLIVGNAVAPAAIASSHREAPFIARAEGRRHQLLPVAQLRPGALYEIHIDNNGDANGRPDVSVSPDGSAPGTL